MANTVKVNDTGVVDAPKSEREARWNSYVENYKKENPAKWELKKKRGEFDKIPDSFK